MPGVIISSGIAPGAIAEAKPYLIEAKAAWPDDWESRPDWLLESAADHAGHQDIGRMHFAVPYGKVRNHHAGPDVEPAIRPRIDAVGQYVRLRIVGDGNQLVTVWQGRVMAEATALGGTFNDGFSNNVNTGTQTFVAYAGLELLRRMQISESKWLLDTEKKTLGVLQPMNRRDENGLLVGNRSEDPFDDTTDFPNSEPTYIHGDGGFTWSRLDYLDYLMWHFVNAPDLPRWRITGQIEYLFQMRDAVTWGPARSIYDMVLTLISPEMGVDFVVRPSDAGFDIEVFALIGEDVSFAGVSVPRNPNTATAQAHLDIGLEYPTIVRTIEHRHERIRIIGRPIVVCFSLYGPRAGVAGADPQADGNDLPVEHRRDSLVAKWTEDMESAYKFGTGTESDSAEAHDASREADALETVYQLLGAPADWDFHDTELLIGIDPASGLITGRLGDERFPTEGQQRFVRQTLTWLPIREGVDYTLEEPEALHPEDLTADLRRPTVWVWDETEGDGGQRYVRAEERGVSVHVSKTDWGVFLQAKPNHKLALNSWADAYDSNTEPEIDWRKCIATIAIELDHRLQLFWASTDENVDFSIRTIYVDDAEFWYLGPGTMVGVDQETGARAHAPDTDGDGGFRRGIVLRNDFSRLGQVMAGAIARYRGERARAELPYHGLLPFTGLIGYILSAVQLAGDTAHIASAITSVEYRISGGRPMTIVRAGHAQT